MKFVAIIFAVIFSVGTAFSQGMESTLEERLTKYMPFFEPRPCSVFLVDFKSPSHGVKVWAEMLGLQPVEIFYPQDTTQYILQYTDPDNPSIVYGFIINKKTDMYIGTYVHLQFKNHFMAIERLEDLKKTMYLHWGSKNRDTTSVSRKCASDDMTHFITASRTGEMLMVTTVCLDLFKP